MSKSLLLKGLILTAIFLTIAVFSFIFLGDTDETVDVPDTTFPDVDIIDVNEPTISQEGEHIPTLKLKDSGGRISVRNFLSDPNVKKLADDFYQITSSGDNDGEFSSSYYYTDDGGIILLLTREPLSVARLLAENELRLLLQLPDESLCGLEILVQTNRYVNINYAGRNLGLSFCPGSVSLE